MLIKFPTSKITIPVHPSAAILSSANYHHRTKKKGKKRNTNSEKYTFKSSFIFIDIVKGEKWGEKKKRENGKAAQRLSIFQRSKSLLKRAVVICRQHVRRKESPAAMGIQLILLDIRSLSFAPR